MRGISASPFSVLTAATLLTVGCADVVGWVVVAPTDAGVDVVAGLEGNGMEWIQVVWVAGLEVAAAGAGSAVLSGFFWVMMKYPAAARTPTQMRARMVVSR